MSSCKCGSDCSCGDDCKCGNSSGLENTTTETIISGVAPVMNFYEGAEYGAENDGCKCGNSCSCGSSCACGK